MKTRTFVVILILVFTVLAMVGSCATGKGAYKREFRKDFIGTWVNPEYNVYHHWPPAKYVIKSDSLMMFYLQETSEWASETTMRIDERWTDVQGYIYYKVYISWAGGFVAYALWRINDAKDTLEMTYYKTFYP